MPGRANTAAPVAIAFLSIIFELAAQTGTASVSGSVFDELGGPVIAARLTMKARDGRLYLGRTTEQGSFRILRMEPGRYILSIDQSGYCRTQSAEIVLQAGEHKTLPRIILTVPAEGQECAAANAQ